MEIASVNGDVDFRWLRAARPAAARRIADFRIPLGLLALGALIVAERDANADPAEVESLIAQGNQLRQKGLPGQALPLFQKAYDLAHTPRTEAQLGLAELAAGYPVEAEHHLGAALDATDDLWIAKNRSELLKVLDKARLGIGEISVEGDPVGASVKVNGRDVGTLPLSGPARVAAGRVDVEMSAPGHARAATSVRVGGREHQVVRLSLRKTADPQVGPPPAPRDAGAGAAQAPIPTTVPRAAISVSPTTAGAETTPTRSDPDTRSVVVSRPDGSSSGLRTGAWIAAGAAVLTAGTGLALNLAALSTNSKFNASCDLQGEKPIPNLNMPTAPGTDCVNMRNTWSTERRWSLAGYAVGAGFALVSGTLFVLSRSGTDSTTTSAYLRCAPGPSGVSCRGAF